MLMKRIQTNAVVEANMVIPDRNVISSMQIKAIEAP